MILKKGYAYLGKCNISSKLQIVYPELSLCSQPVLSQGQEKQPQTSSGGLSQPPRRKQRKP